MLDYKQILDNLENHIEGLENQLSHALQELESVYDMAETEPNNMKLGKMVRSFYWQHTEEVEDEPVYIYESPDEGKTLYRREIGAAYREKLEKSKQMDLFDENETK